MRTNGPLLPLRQKGHDAVMQHGQQLRRRSGQHNHKFPFRGFHGAARSGPHRIGKDRAAPGQQGLLALIDAHGTRSEVFPQPGKALGVFLQRRSRHPRHGFPGQIVVRGAQPAGSDKKIVFPQTVAKRFFETPGIVAHNAAAENVNTEFRQRPRHMRGVAVDGMAQQQLGSHSYNFRLHFLPPGAFSV